MYAISPPLAAVRFSSEFNNSDMFLTVIPGKFLLNTPGPQCPKVEGLNGGVTNTVHG